MAWSLSAPCSSTMAELVAIRQALLMINQREVTSVAILSDSRAAIQAILRPTPKLHKALILEIRHRWDIIQAKGARIRLTWIPGHAHIRGNERADVLAKNVTLTPQVMLRFPLPRTAINQLVKVHVTALVEGEHQLQLATNSASTKWYQATTATRPTPVDALTPRWLATSITRIRLGFPCSWEVVEQTNRACQHCGRDTRGALAHYLLECEHTTPLRRGGPDTTNMDKTEGAAAMARHMLEDIDAHIDTLHSYPPPR